MNVPYVMRLSRLAASGLLLFGAGCSDVKRAATTLVQRFSPPGTPDSLPALLTNELPFHYPPGLYLSQIQDDVVLRIHVDGEGHVVPESTVVTGPSRHPEFDSSAVAGASQLRFRPAMMRGKPVPLTVLFPVKFRVPNAPAMPSDTGGNGKP